MANQKPKTPGQLGEIRFPVRASLLLGVLVITAGIFYHLCPALRDTERFMATGFAMAAAILGAYYVGRGLQDTVRQREEEIRDRRVARAFHYVERWNDPALLTLKHKWRIIVDSAKDKSSEELAKELADDLDKSTIVVEVLNFFEEISLAVNEGVADEETAIRLFGGAMREYFSTLKLWMEKRRAVRNRPKMWIEFETMILRWNVR